MFRMDRRADPGPPHFPLAVKVQGQREILKWTFFLEN